MKKIKYVIILLILVVLNWQCLLWNFSPGTMNIFSTYRYNCSKNELCSAIKQFYIKYPDTEPKEKRKIPTSFDSTYANLLKSIYADSVYFGFNLSNKNLHFAFEIFDDDDSISGLKLRSYYTIIEKPFEIIYSGNEKHSQKEEKQMVIIFEDEILIKIETILKEQTGRKIIRSKLYPK